MGVVPPLLPPFSPQKGGVTKPSCFSHHDTACHVVLGVITTIMDILIIKTPGLILTLPPPEGIGVRGPSGNAGRLLTGRAPGLEGSTAAYHRVLCLAQQYIHT